MVSVILRASLVVKKSIVSLTLLEERTSEASWRLHFLIPAGCWLEGFTCDSVEWTRRSRRLGLRL